MFLLSVYLSFGVIKMKPEIISLAETLKELGFVVYLADNKNYGIYSDNTGNRVVYFQYDTFGGYQFSGTYKANLKCGTGWRLEMQGLAKPDFEKALNTIAPYWATQGYKPTYQTLQTYIKDNKHSKYYLF